jgi:hypothetical protein
MEGDTIIPLILRLVRHCATRTHLFRLLLRTGRCARWPHLRPSQLLFSLYTMKRRSLGSLKKHPVKKYVASLNRTQAARVAGTCSTTGPWKPILISE